jgi:uncharacterized phage protein gp47/JayE
MPYIPPTIAETRSQIITDIEGKIGQTTPILARAFNRVLSWALSGVLALLYAFVKWVYDQISPVTCDLAMLLYWGQRYNLLPKDASASLLAITVSGTNGSVCAAGTLWQSADNGLVYSQVADATISGTTASAQMECLTEGADGNLDPALTLTLPSPVAGITGAVVASTVEAGVDAETTEDYRVRILQRMRYQSIVGTAAGYITQALQVEGIVKAFAKRKTSSSDIQVYPLVASTGANRIPDAPTLAIVQAYLQSVSRRLLSVTVTAEATVERTCAITITGLSPGDAATKATVEAAIDAYMYGCYPKQYDDEPAGGDIVDVGHIWAIILAAGATATAVSINISGIGGGPYTLPIGEIVKKGTLTWA